MTRLSVQHSEPPVYAQEDIGDTAPVEVEAPAKLSWYKRWWKAIARPDTVWDRMFGQEW